MMRSAQLGHPLTQMSAVYRHRLIQHAERINIQVLPVEIILMILRFLPVLDLIPLLRVCKLFRQLLMDDLLWRSLYKRTVILRPPGPFISQSTAFLRKTLISSARVARNWPPTASLPAPRLGPTFRMHHNILFSDLLDARWLIAGNKQVVWCYDLQDSDPIPTLFYQPHMEATFFRCLSTTSESGEQLTFAVSESWMGGVTRGINIYKVSIYDTGPVIVSRILRQDISHNDPGIADINIGPRLLIVTRHTDAPPIILDIATFRRYHVGTPRSLLKQIPPLSTSIHSTFVSTASYLLALYDFLAEGNAKQTLVLACPLQKQAHSHREEEVEALQASHFTWIQMEISDVTVLREASMDAQSTTTHISLVGRKCGDRSTGAGPLMTLTLTLDEMGSITHESTSLSCVTQGPMWLDAGPDGCARGVYTWTQSHFVLFSVQDDLTNVAYHKSQTFSVPRESNRRSVIAFDGYSGVLCVKEYRRLESINLETSCIEVWNFA
ncbi:hypothetical protein HYDPIDRAFT_113556 [Hydnomerulius pinastri MD-312]|uniref:F-box domain-containing protein n=1 Tax=Hydnomerulius pinastri MD-312 TaxID=994086 RepID=A0A0C9VXP8_9AGAM|nr:hypothetical protein HYDPIDRAFT_113556 [Hydnomerulius pinastri MD-312]